MSYILIIKYASFVFPFIAFMVTFPYILVQYHKYGSISLLKSVIIYLFIYYLICAYFLVILPLPKVSDVIKLTTPRVQLMPFEFIFDFIKNSSFSIFDIKSYIPAFFESYVYVPLFNIFLTIPFGMFLHYYFEYSLKKTVLFSFLLSLFFELTQLSGLYFIYPRGYRLFDVDDLILNTLGGVIGYYFVNIFLKYFPTININRINEEALNQGKKVSGFKRVISCFLDFIIFMFLFLITTIFFRKSSYFYFLIFLYYFIIPLLLAGSTVGEKFLNLKVVDYEDNFNFFRLVFRRVAFIFFYCFLPLISFNLFSIIAFSTLKLFLFILFISLFLIVFIISFMKFLFSNKPLFYEMISKTKLVSTIK